MLNANLSSAPVGRASQLTLTALVVLLLAGPALAKRANLYGTVTTTDAQAWTITFANKRTQQPVTFTLPNDAPASRLKPERVRVTPATIYPGDELILTIDDATDPFTVIGLRITTPPPEGKAAGEQATSRSPRRAKSQPQPQPANQTLPRVQPLHERAPKVEPESLPWTEPHAHRVIVYAPPFDLGDRANDLAPAELRLEGEGRRINIAGLRVVRLDPETGQPTPDGQWALADNPAHRPTRWYDDAVPYDFPHVLRRLDTTGDQPQRRTDAGLGHKYLTVGDWASGRLAFTHRQVGEQPSLYAVYFDYLSRGDEPREPAPRGWIGDGSIRTELQSKTTLGSSHLRIEPVDWDGDGVTDLITGDHHGQLLLLPNVGMVSEPRFNHVKLIMLANGLPLDAGQHAAPVVVDWDNDGTRDLLVGTHASRVSFYRNRDPKGWALEFAGVVQIDGAPMELPHSPIVGRKDSIFNHDYYPVLDVVDFDGDGDHDLLAGGYVTGRVFVFKQTGQLPDGQPRLEHAGVLRTADGPINVGDWCAAPELADLDMDGHWEMISGRMPMTPGSQEDERPLLYFEQHAEDPMRFDPAPFPADQPFMRGYLTTPRLADFNGDTLPDLAYTSGANLYLSMNRGSSSEPRFETPTDHVRLSHGAAPLPGWDFIDVNGDGITDVVGRYTAFPGPSQALNPFGFGPGVDVLEGQEPIDHNTGIGDDWYWPRLIDLDQDGDRDVLFGDWHGHIYYHEKTDSGFEPDGVALTTRD